MHRAMPALRRTGEPAGTGSGSRAACRGPSGGCSAAAAGARAGAAAGGVAVTPAEVFHAMRFAFEHLKIVAEPGGAVALAALLAGKLDARGRCFGVVISGGNVDPAVFARALAAA